MKKQPVFLIVIMLMIWSPILKAQTTPSVEPADNPRISGGQAYVKDSVGAQNKSVTRDTTQKDPNRPIQGGVLSLAGVLGFPRGDFSRNTDNAIGYGFDLTILFNLAEKRSRSDWELRWVNMYIGGNFQFMRQDGAGDSYSFDDQYATTKITSKVKNNMTGIGAIGRVEFFPGNFKLFIEGGAGTRIFTGKHTYEVENTPYNSSDPAATQTTTTNKVLRSVVVGNLNYGGGFRVCGESVGVEVKVLYVNGGDAEYVDIQSIRFDRNTGSVTYDTKRSSTDMITFQIGLAGRF
jgi:hypothetical protein